MSDDGRDAMRGNVNEHLANERTFLAWMRTALGIMGLGFVMAKFSVWLRQLLGAIAPGHVSRTTGGASLPVGLALIAMGALLAVLSYRRYESVRRAVEEGRGVPATSLIRLMVVLIVLASASIIVYLFLTSQSVWAA